MTLEDLIEEIVGEIHDEHEPESPHEIQLLEDGGFRVRGNVLVRELNEVLSPRLLDGEADTVGGVVLRLLGRMPEVGDQVSVPGWTVQVCLLGGRRVEIVEFHRRAPTDRTHPVS